MLVLSRKVQQQILIPELGICITVLTVGSSRVQIGIEAPEGIQITRPEAGSLPKVVERRPIRKVEIAAASTPFLPNWTTMEAYTHCGELSGNLD